MGVNTGAFLYLRDWSLKIVPPLSQHLCVALSLVLLYLSMLICLVSNGFKIAA